MCVPALVLLQYRNLLLIVVESSNFTFSLAHFVSSLTLPALSLSMRAH